MTVGDMQFLREVGIDTRNLGDPSPSPLTPPPPTEAPVPALTAEDARWLQNLRVAWVHEPEPDFIVPKTLWEYLGRFPNSVREAVGEVATELELAMPDGSLDDLAQEVTQMFVDFAALDLEDVVVMYPFHRPLHRGGCDFHDYMKFRTRAALETLGKLDPPSW